MTEPGTEKIHRSGIHYRGDETGADGLVRSVYVVWLDWRPVMLVGGIADESGADRTIYVAPLPSDGDAPTWLPTTGRWEMGHSHVVDQNFIQRYVMPRRHRLLADVYVGPRGRAPVHAEASDADTGIDTDVESNDSGLGYEYEISAPWPLEDGM